jgi:chromosome partitioning protein
MGNSIANRVSSERSDSRASGEVGPKIIAIANQKGGVGKTTTAVNLSAALASEDKRVLVVDCDPQGNATSGLGFPRGTVEQGIYQALIDKVSLRELTQLTAMPTLWLVPSTADLAGAEVELVNQPRREWHLRDALSTVESRYDYIILDCPPSLGLLTLNALVASHEVLIPMQAEYYALEGLSYLCSTIERVRAVWNPKLELEGIVLTMVDGRTNLMQQVEGEVRSHFGPRVYRTVVPRNVRLSEAPSHGLPIMLYDSASRGAQSYFQLAHEFLERRAAAASRSRAASDEGASAPGTV